MRHHLSGLHVLSTASAIAGDTKSTNTCEGSRRHHWISPQYQRRLTSPTGRTISGCLEPLAGAYCRYPVR